MTLPSVSPRLQHHGGGADTASAMALLQRISSRNNSNNNAQANGPNGANSNGSLEDSLHSPETSARNHCARACTVSSIDMRSLSQRRTIGQRAIATARCRS